MATACEIPSDYRWEDCEDFQVPDNSVWFGRDDDGSDIFCGKAWSDGQEVPAKIIPDKRECRVRCDSGEKVVPNCKKVLICQSSGSGDECRRRRRCRSHCRRRRSHCRRRDSDCCRSESEDEAENSSHTKTTSSSNNESRLLVRSVKSSSNTTTVTVKKNKKKKKKHNHSHNGQCREECWDEERTRMVPKVSVTPRVRYEPKVTMERTVRYVPERYVTRVCAERSRCEDSCRERCEDSCDSWESCDDECVVPNERCKEVLVCERPSKCSEKKEERCIRPERCDSPPRRAKCW